MSETNHDALREMSGLYVLGALAGRDREDFEAHLATCAACAAEVRALGGVTGVLPYAVPQVDPPAALRERILARAGAPRSASGDAVTGAVVRPRPRFARAGWLSAAALLLLSVGLGGYAVSLRGRMTGLELRLSEAQARLDRTEQQLAAAVRATEAAVVRVAVLTAPDLLQVNLAGQAAAPSAAGRAFFSRSRGLLFAATNLPPLPAGRTYQLWYLTSAAPVSAGLLRPEPDGQVAVRFDVTPDAPAPAGLAVSIEPDGGVPAPTGALYLAGTTE
jgi:anti-sigma-K factor RskA